MKNKSWLEPMRALRRRFSHSSDRLAAEFSPAALEISHAPPAPAGRALLWFILSACSMALAWSFIGRVDVVVAARGELVPPSRSKDVQAPISAQVAAIHIQDGQIVEAGALLIELNPTEALADKSRLSVEFVEARLSMARLNALLGAPEDPHKAASLFASFEGAPDDAVERHRAQLISAATAQRARLSALRADHERSQAEVQSAAAELERLEASLPFIRQNVSARRELVEKGVLARLPQLELERQLVESEKARDVLIGRMRVAQAAARQLRHSIDETQAEFERAGREELQKSTQAMQSLEQELVKAQFREEAMRLTAPVSGSVQLLRVHGAGAIVGAGQTLLTIVPLDAALEAEVRIENKDIGLIHQGQRVAVKIDAYDFTRYGLYEGKLRTIAREAVPPAQTDPSNPVLAQMPENVYVARVALSDEGRDGKPAIRLAPGMAATAEIKIGRRRIIDYVLSPVTASLSESLREP